MINTFKNEFEPLKIRELTAPHVQFTLQGVRRIEEAEG